MNKQIVVTDEETGDQHISKRDGMELEKFIAQIVEAYYAEEIPYDYVGFESIELRANEPIRITVSRDRNS
jgi:hypothetical protein